MWEVKTGTIPSVVFYKTMRSRVVLNIDEAEKEKAIAMGHQSMKKEDKARSKGVLKQAGIEKMD